VAATPQLLALGETELRLHLVFTGAYIFLGGCDACETAARAGDAGFTAECGFDFFLSRDVGFGLYYVFQGWRIGDTYANDLSTAAQFTPPVWTLRLAGVGRPPE
jgi:hypothetical protein